MCNLEERDDKKADSWRELPEILDPGVYSVGSVKFTVKEPIFRGEVKYVYKKYVSRGRILV